MKFYVGIFTRFILLMMLAAIVSIQAKAETQPPDPYWQGTLGPLTIHSLAPVQSFRLTPVPRSPYGLPEGQTEIQFNIAAASIYIKEVGKYFMDFHFTDTRLAINHGFANNWSAQFSIIERRITNAHLDQLTLNFHDLFGLDQDGRTEVPKNDTRIQIDEFGIDLGKQIRGDYSQTLGISIHKVLIDKSESWPAVAININMSYELLNDGIMDKGTIDYGVQFSAAQKYNSGYAYANISFTHFDSNQALGIALKNNQTSGMLGYEYKVDDNESLILQYLFTEGAVKNLGALSDYSNEVHIGYKWRTDSYLWEVGFVENIINFDNGPDVAFTFGVTRRI